MNKYGFFRVGSVSAAVRVADVPFNTSSIIQSMGQCVQRGVRLAVFPELCLTGYSCGDLFHTETLLEAARRGLLELEAVSADYRGTVFIVGVPLVRNGILYNCAAVMCGGSLCAVIPKTYLPDYNEFYERRMFGPGAGSSGMLSLGGKEVPFGTDIVLDIAGVKAGVEICEDLWVPAPPSTWLALAGAEVIVNLSASNAVIGKYDYMMQLVSQQSARCICGYAYASAGFGESSTDLVFDGKLAIAENGRLLAGYRRQMENQAIVAADIDIAALRHDRMHNNSFGRCAASYPGRYRTVSVRIEPQPEQTELLRTVEAYPFVPGDDGNRRRRCEEIIGIQTQGLATRLAATHTRKLIIGISGGLDSTLALLVAVRAFDAMGLDRKGIVGVTMPGFGTTGRTYTNAIALMRGLGVCIREIPIAESVNLHFRDIGHDPEVEDITYENCQARERTQILMDLSNELGGMVLGTGDMSELALGWATYNGDHMSMYGVNAGVPKTLVRHLVHYFAEDVLDGNVRTTLLDIIDTPISPELKPAAEDGTIAQKTEDAVGPYVLHDFFLYYMLRYGFGPRRIYMLATEAFVKPGMYDGRTVAHWLKVFFKRFFAQQFKRSCLPDGPKVGSVCISPRGDWRMPSDATAAIWLAECDAIVP